MNLLHILPFIPLLPLLKPNDSMLAGEYCCLGQTYWLQMRSSQCKQTLCTHVVLQTDMQTHAWSPTPRWKTWSRMADLIWPEKFGFTGNANSTFFVWLSADKQISAEEVSAEVSKLHNSHTQHLTVFQLARWGGSSNNMTWRFWNYFWYWISKQGCVLLQWLHTW